MLRVSPRFRKSQFAELSSDSFELPFVDNGDYNVITIRGGTVKAHLVQIGNSRGVRLPKAVLEEAQLGDEVDLKAEPGCIVIRSVRKTRAGWAEAARQMNVRGDDRLLDPPSSTQFDREEWKWK